MLDRKSRSASEARSAKKRARGNADPLPEVALKGDIKSAAFLLQRYDLVESAQEHATNGATLEDQEIIDAYLQAHLKNGGKQK